MGQYNSIDNYYSHIAFVINDSNLISNPLILRYQYKDRLKGVVFSEIPFVFHNGGEFRFFENIEIIENGIVHRKTYSFRYHNDKISFRYEKGLKGNEQKNGSIKVSHPLHHLHTSMDEKIRFFTHPTSFDEFYNWLIATFYK